MSDLISRQAATDAMGCISDSICEQQAIDALWELPAIEAEPIKHGRWKDKEDPYGFFDTIPVCSECGHTTKMREKYRYCPNCGARMDGGEDD